MCLTPIHKKSNTKYFSPAGLSRIWMDLPCGKCAECLEMKKTERYFRTYMQIHDTLSKGGFVLFDTLTYDDQYVPHISDQYNVDSQYDFTCFNPEHFRSFMGKLRKRLKRKGINADEDHLKYLFVSEYGTSDQPWRDKFGFLHNPTHRPHYHVLFFSTDPRLGPETLSWYISQCWIYGKCDGMVDRGRAYMLHNTFQKGADPARLRGLSEYVVKYMDKSSDFQQKIDNRIDAMVRTIYEDDSVYLNYVDSARELFDRKYIGSRWFFDKEQYKRRLKRYVDKYIRRKVSRSISQYSRISRGYGLGYLKSSDFDWELFFSKGMVKMPDSQKVYVFLPMPMYYLRKLFYETRKAPDGSRYWMPKNEGVQYLKRRAAQVSDRTVKKWKDFILNLSKDDRQVVDSYIDDSFDWKGFGDYLTYRRGRIGIDGLSNDEIIGISSTYDPYYECDATFNDLERDEVFSIGEYDEWFEEVYSVLRDCYSRTRAVDRQNTYDHLEHLKKTFKIAA